MHSRAVVCRASGANFAHAVSRFSKNPGGIAGFAEEIAERLFGQWLAADARTSRYWIKSQSKALEINVLSDGEPSYFQ